MFRRKLDMKGFLDILVDRPREGIYERGWTLAFENFCTYKELRCIWCYYYYIFCTHVFSCTQYYHFSRPSRELTSFVKQNICWNSENVYTISS